MSELELVNELKKYIYKTYLKGLEDFDEVKKYWFDKNHNEFVVRMTTKATLKIKLDTSEVFLSLFNLGHLSRLLCKNDLKVIMMVERILKNK